MNPRPKLSPHSLTALNLLILWAVSEARWVNLETPLNTAPPGWEDMGPSAPAQYINLVFSVRQDDDALERLASTVTHPSHPNHGQYLSFEEIGSRFADPESAQEVVYWLTKYIGSSHGWFRTSPNLDWIEAQVNVQAANKMLNTTFHDYCWKHTTGPNKPIVARVLHYQVPPSVSPYLNFIGNTISFLAPSNHSSVLNTSEFMSTNKVNSDTAHQQPSDGDPNASISWQPASDRRESTSFANETAITAPCYMTKNGCPCFETSVPSASYIGYKKWCNVVTPAQLRLLYGIGSRHVSTDESWPIERNQSASQGIFAQSSYQQPNYYSDSDLALYGQMKDQNPQSSYIRREQSASCPFCFDSLQPGVESSLDVQVISGIAQGSPTTFYSGHGNEGGSLLLSWIQNLASKADVPLVLSISYGWPEYQMPPSYIRAFNTAAMKLSLRGVTIIAASGDDGVLGAVASSCYRANEQDGHVGAPRTAGGFNPVFPAVSPWVTAVGATQGPEAGFEEVACAANNLPPSSITSGGGFSLSQPRPDWQSETVNSYLYNNTPQMPSDATRSSRGYPDVALLGNSYVIYVNKRITILDGTSAAAPLLAGMITLINDARLDQGLGPVGHLAPLLYQMPAEVFNDITLGSNNCPSAGWMKTNGCCPHGFTAAEGWDPVTGLGSVNFEALKAALLIPEDNTSEQPETCTHMLTMSETDPSACVDNPSFFDIYLFSCSEWVGFDCFNYIGYSAQALAQVRENCPKTCNTCPTQTFVRTISNTSRLENFAVGACSPEHGLCTSNSGVSAGAHTILDSGGVRVGFGTCCSDGSTNQILSVESTCKSSTHQNLTSAAASPVAAVKLLHWADDNVCYQSNTDSIGSELVLNKLSTCTNAANLQAKPKSVRQQVLNECMQAEPAPPATNSSMHNSTGCCQLSPATKCTIKFDNVSASPGITTTAKSQNCNGHYCCPIGLGLCQGCPNNSTNAPSSTPSPSGGEYSPSPTPSPSGWSRRDFSSQVGVSTIQEVVSHPHDVSAGRRDAASGPSVATGPCTGLGRPQNQPLDVATGTTYTVHGVVTGSSAVNVNVNVSITLFTKAVQKSTSDMSNRPDAPSLCNAALTEGLLPDLDCTFDDLTPLVPAGADVSGSGCSLGHNVSSGAVCSVAMDGSSCSNAYCQFGSWVHTPICTSSPAFQVASGPCIAQGKCVISQHFGLPDGYNDNEVCVIVPKSTGPLSVTSFSTESCCDHLKIGSVKYSGSVGPSGTFVDSSTAIEWESDGSVVSAGWELCIDESMNKPTCAYNHLVSAGLLPVNVSVSGPDCTLGRSVDEGANCTISRAGYECTDAACINGGEWSRPSCVPASCTFDDLTPLVPAGADVSGSTCVPNIPIRSGTRCPTSLAGSLCRADCFQGAWTVQCKPCQAGYVCAQGSTGETACSPGQYCPAGSASSSPCPAGFYCPSQAADMVYVHHFGAMAVATNATASASGSNTASTPGVKLPCPAGGYCPQGSSSPQLCAPGKYNSLVEQSDSSACKDCSAGMLCRGGTSSEDECPAGWFCGAAVDPEECPAGTSNELTGQSDPSACKQCADGNYAPSAGTSSCTTCGAGYVCAQGSTGETACSPGQYCPAGSASSLPCPAGFYCPSQAADMVYVHHFGAMAVATNATASASGSNTTFTPGVKLPCPAGGYCPQGSSSPVLCPQGTANPLSQQSDLDSCKDCTTLQVCPVGTSAPDLIFVPTTSSGLKAGPLCSWMSKCSWDAFSQQQCADALCISAGFISGHFVKSSNNPCNAKPPDSLPQPPWGYMLDQNAFDQQSFNYASKISALCLANVSQMPPTTAPTSTPQQVCPEYAVTFNGMCYASMDQQDARSTASTCQSDYITMPTGWELVPFSQLVLQNVVEQYHFGTDVIVFANGAGYTTDGYSEGAGTLFGDSESKFQRASGVNAYKTPWCSYKVLMQKSASGTGSATEVPSLSGSPSPTPTSTAEPDLGVLKSAQANVCVTRGPDWKWGDQDHQGKGLTTSQSPGASGWVNVDWVLGSSNNYRVGAGGAYDLIISSHDTATCTPSEREYSPSPTPSPSGGEYSSSSTPSPSGSSSSFGISQQAQTSSSMGWWRRNPQEALTASHYDLTSYRGQVLRSVLLRAVADLANVPQHDVAISAISDNQRTQRVEIDFEVAQAVSPSFLASMIDPAGFATKFESYAVQQGINIAQHTVFPTHGFDSVTELDSLAPTSKPTSDMQVDWSSKYTFIFSVSNLDVSSFDSSTAEGRAIRAAFTEAVASIANVALHEVKLLVSVLSKRRASASATQVEIQLARTPQADFETHMLTPDKFSKQFVALAKAKGVELDPPQLERLMQEEARTGSAASDSLVWPLVGGALGLLVVGAAVVGYLYFQRQRVLQEKDQASPRSLDIADCEVDGLPTDVIKEITNPLNDDLHEVRPPTPVDKRDDPTIELDAFQAEQRTNNDSCVSI